MRRELIIIAAVGALLSVLYVFFGLRYPVGTMARPGPGIWPLLVGILMFAGAVGTGLGALAANTGDAIEWPKGAALGRIGAIVLASAGYVVLLPSLGHPVVSTLLTLIVLHVMAMRSWLAKIAIALAVGIGSQYAFAKLLSVQLPAGIWPW